jgi:hypothetical protein
MEKMVGESCLTGMNLWEGYFSAKKPSAFQDTLRWASPKNRAGFRQAKRTNIKEPGSSILPVGIVQGEGDTTTNPNNPSVTTHIFSPYVA